MMYITSKVTGEKKATITMATEKRLQELMNREHQSNEAKFLTWALEEYKCECGCGGASIKEIRKYAEQEDWLRDEFCFDTEGYMEDTARAMNNRFHDYMAYWCRLCHSSLSIKSFNKLVKAVYDMTDEYGYINYPEEESETETTEEVVESEEETTVSETETVEKIKEETTMAKRFYFTNENGDNIGNDHIGNIRGAKAAAKRLANEFNCEVCINDCETEDMLDFVYPDRKPETETAETVESVEETTVSETETVEETAEQTAEPETFSYEFNEIHKITISKRNNVYVEEFFEKMGGSYVKLGEEAWGCIEDIEEYYGIKINRNVQTDTEESESESESEPTADSNTVETYQGNINVLIVADIANTFEMITHTGYFDTS